VDDGDYVVGVSWGQAKRLLQLGLLGFALAVVLLSVLGLFGLRP
jgi:hypothetical protein